MKENLLVSLGFAKLPDAKFGIFGTRIKTEMYSPASAVLYPSPPLTEAVFSQKVTDYSNAMVATENGGKLATAEKKRCREALREALRELAAYVQMACKGDLPTLLASGFDAVSTNRTREPLPKLEIQRIVAGMSGQTLVTAEAQRNARSYEIRMAEVDYAGTLGPWFPSVASTSSRRISFTGQTPGRLYAFQGRSFGSTGYSDWSDVVVQRAA